MRKTDRAMDKMAKALQESKQKVISGRQTLPSFVPHANSLLARHDVSISEVPSKHE